MKSICYKNLQLRPVSKIQIKFRISRSLNMKSSCLFIIALLFFHSAHAQAKKDTVRCTGMQVVTTRSTIEGYLFNKTLSISKEELKKGFTLVSSDGNWKVDGFVYFYDFADGDIYMKQVLGNTVNPDEHDIFKKLKKGEVLDFTCINIERNGKRYLAQGFSVIIID